VRVKCRLMATSFAPVPAAAVEVDQLVYQSDVGAVGVFRCAATHSLFHDSGPIRNHCVVFPRTAVTIHRRDHAPFQADPTITPVYPPGLEYGRRPIDAWGDRCDYFVLGAELAGSVEALFVAPHVRSSAATYLRQRAVVDTLVSGGVHDDLHIDETIVEVVSAVASVSETPAPPARVPLSHRLLAEGAQFVLAQDPGAKISLSGLAKLLGCSAFHLCRVFRAATGMSLHQYRTELRLRASLERLEQGLDVTRVALDLGFSSHSHFTAAFRKRFGRAPRHRQLPRRLSISAR